MVSAVVSAQTRRCAAWCAAKAESIPNSTPAREAGRNTQTFLSRSRSTPAREAPTFPPTPFWGSFTVRPRARGWQELSDTGIPVSVSTPARARQAVDGGQPSRRRDAARSRRIYQLKTEPVTKGAVTRLVTTQNAIQPLVNTLANSKPRGTHRPGTQVGTHGIGGYGAPKVAKRYPAAAVTKPQKDVTAKEAAHQDATERDKPACCFATTFADEVP